ncbi:uncharacterized protein OCT59_024038 [Rhizophagus irregularis]|nr:Kic1p [Rhizophagus irregularis DAOM 197198w]UZO03634.1 hypothetical protein OCT59_024038 [Rhizophagus irregularis]GBC22177.1 kinase-like domain-containing protein [Rhizophagus irregularis DAOM 181602=DAOM 197198]
MEYADSGTLRDYLKNNFHRLTWDNKYNLASQLACSVRCLHEEGIVHRDLHSCNVLVHQDSIKLADFGLSKRIDEASKSQSKLLGMVPYIDPKVLMDNNLRSNKKSDIYSIGVLLWEISSGKPPFREEKYDFSLMYKISQGRRETTVPNTPNDYSSLYSECWNNEPSERPTIHEVVNRLKVFISNSNNVTIYQQHDISDQPHPIPNTPNSIRNSLHGELFQTIQDFTNMNTNEMDNITSINKQINENFPSEKNLGIIIIGIVDLIFKKVNKRTKKVKQRVLDYLNNYNINSKEIYNWVLNNQNTSESIFLLGYFNYYSIGTTEDKEKAFNLFINASEENHILAQYFVGQCYEFGNGITENETLAFEYYEKAANKDYASGQFKLGWFYDNGISVKKDLKMAAYWYEKAANNRHLTAMYNLGHLYKNGDGVDKDHQKAFELFKKSAEGGYSSGITMLGRCYSSGIGVNIDKKKAVKLYQKAANLGENNLALKYEKGDGVKKDLDKATYWYEHWYKHSAKQGYQKLKIV